VDSNCRKMLDDLDARLLLDCNAEVRHAEILSAAIVTASLSFLSIFAALIVRYRGPLLEWLFVPGGVASVFGIWVAVVGRYLQDRTQSAAKRARTSLTRLAERHGRELSDMPDASNAMLASGATRWPYRLGALPWLVTYFGLTATVLGFGLVIVGIIFAILEIR
jgi:hypothetical protein